MSNKERIEQNSKKIENNNTKLTSVSSSVNLLSGLTKDEYNACLTLTKSIDNLDNYSDTSATAEDIKVGKTAYSNGELLVGTLEPNENNVKIATDITCTGYDNKVYCFGLLKTITRLPDNLVFRGNLAYNFVGFSNLEELVGVDCQYLTTLSDAFMQCGIKHITLKNTQNVTNFEFTFMACRRLISAPEMDTSNATTFRQMFSECDALVDVPVYNTSKVTNFTSMFMYSTNLSNESLNNILQMCVNAKSYTGTKTLKILSITQELAERCKSLSNYEVFIAAGWTTGY